MLYSTILFDLDGTLTNSKEGIINSLHYALDEMCITHYDEEQLEGFIGPPLQQSFKKIFKMDEQEVEKAVLLFREYYAEKGLYENEPYPGIIDLLSELHNYGRKIYVATSKLEKYAKIVLDHFELSPYIDDLKGSDYSGNGAGKTQLIQFLLDKYQVKDTSKVVMVGDTHFDMFGAIECGIDKIAVGYGFGAKQELIKFQPQLFAETVEDLHDFLMK